MSYIVPPDCGDNSCYFAKDKSGMRTNGGCRCLRNDPRSVEKYARLLQQENRLLRSFLLDVITQACGEYQSDTSNKLKFIGYDPKGLRAYEEALLFLIEIGLINNGEVLR